MKFWKKPTAAMLMAFMFWFGFFVEAPIASAENAENNAPLITADAIDRAADEVTHVSGKASKPCRSVEYTNILADPVAPNWQPDPAGYKILTLTEESCGSMQTGSGKTIRAHLRKGMAIAVPRNGEGELRVVACGNPYVPEGHLVGKYFECPTLTCPEPQVRTIEVPGPVQPVDLCRNMDGFQETVPPGYILDENGNCNPRSLGLVPAPAKRPWCLRGYGPVVCFVLPAALLGYALSHHGKKECSDCCPTCPPRTKPNP